ncbi:hypothetical protein NCCP2222_12900 [Sporosarcina sp. NCCP-2222]|uniref:hypothetical protein n=1 Tax=Sporosarcina sp. NCCP-2222 TaxID=2935073 RepID=UPI0020885AE8|nr:hypothetical protein [Sporosarcina sp. NCCP-2222]GKV55343.1 hypothetical protein NCCP2222_12900 [Sporosarcina sp. NCCP-2222]
MNKTISDKTPHWDYGIEKILNLKILEDTIKFHQSSTRIVRDTSDNMNPELDQWLLNVEYTDILPNVYKEEIKLSIENKKNFNGSERDFTSENLGVNEFSELIYNSFGRNKESTSKRYPSAGALYPVIPLIYLFEENSINGLDIGAGVYVLNTQRNTLRQIKSYTQTELNEINNTITKITESKRMISKYCIGYSIDMKRAIGKYQRRGYRHALIEVGLAAQSFKESCIEMDKIGQVCWSGYDDNAFTFLSGMNVRNAPVVLIQWFGKVVN